jgi:hypothetical protein
MAAGEATWDASVRLPSLHAATKRPAALSGDDWGLVGTNTVVGGTVDAATVVAAATEVVDDAAEVVGARPELWCAELHAATPASAGSVANHAILDIRIIRIVPTPANS